ncbi:uncharacterized protein LOC142354230 [Convolutriloba macropyga]|uniref:uncharacterized protein LOC142354230 n=1 Tax=Convolutriloba macropyga TaxID=536237 RepID=UPI003F5250B8
MTIVLSLKGYSTECPAPANLTQLSTCTIRSVVDKADFVLYEIARVISYGEGGETDELFFTGEMYLFYPWPIPISSGCIHELNSCFLQFDSGKASKLLEEQGIKVLLYGSGSKIPLESTAVPLDCSLESDRCSFTLISDINRFVWMRCSLNSNWLWMIPNTDMYTAWIIWDVCAAPGMIVGAKFRSEGTVSLQ